jgi:DNA-binding transcriptional LysR family regulator
VQLDWIESFLGIVDSGGFHAASEALHRSQPRVSAHIGFLERELQVVLFDRRRRPVALTAAGRAFEPHARAIQRELGQAREAVEEVQGLIRGEVTLGTYPSAGATFVPVLLERFLGRHPGVHVSLFEGGVAGLDEALVSGRVDLAVRPQLPEPTVPDLEVVPLWRERMCVIIPDDHRWAGRRDVAAEELEGEPLIITGREQREATEAGGLLHGLGIRPAVAFVSDQPQTLVGLVRHRLGVGLTNWLALETVEHGGTAVLDVEPPLWRTATIVRHRRAARSAAAEALWSDTVVAPVPAGTYASS